MEIAPPDTSFAPSPIPPAPSTLLDRARASLAQRGQIVLAGSPRGAASQLALALAEELVAGGDGFLEHVVFHPAWRYADFMQVDGADGARRTGLFPAFCQAAAARRDACVLVVDEAERAELAAVCGEALALLGLRGRAVALAGGGTLAVPSNVRVVFTLDGTSRAGRDALVELAPLCDVVVADEVPAD